MMSQKGERYRWERHVSEDTSRHAEVIGRQTNDCNQMTQNIHLYQPNNAHLQPDVFKRTAEGTVGLKLKTSMWEVWHRRETQRRSFGMGNGTEYHRPVAHLGIKTGEVVVGDQKKRHQQGM